MPELIDGVAVEIKSTRLNDKRRLQNAEDIHKICLGLVNISRYADDSTEIYSEKKPTQTFRIAHFSVQEYLKSEHIQRQKADIFSLTGVTAHAEIAQICLIYLLEPGLSVTKLDNCLLEKYPLARFAAMYWYHHYMRAGNHDFKLDGFVLMLFRQRYSFLIWTMLHDLDEPRPFDLIELKDLDKPTPLFPGGESASIPSPVYYASLLGLGRVLHELIATKPQENEMTYSLPLTITSKSAGVNVEGGRYGNALQAASLGGYKRVVQLLVEMGADVNARGGQYGSPLQAASEGGHEKVVQLLVKNGADVKFEVDL